MPQYLRHRFFIRLRDVTPEEGSMTVTNKNRQVFSV